MNICDENSVKRRGFTLVELIVVMAVLAILAAIMIPLMIGIQDRAKTRVDETNARILTDIASWYHAGNGEYPGGEEGWPPDDEAFTSISGIEGLNDELVIKNSKNVFVYDQNAGIVSVESADEHNDT